MHCTVSTPKTFALSLMFVNCLIMRNVMFVDCLVILSKIALAHGHYDCKTIFVHTRFEVTRTAASLHFYQKYYS